MTLSTAKELFGQAGSTFYEIVSTLAPRVPGTEYRFMEPEKFRQLLKQSPGEGIRVYWLEMLYRAHWAAASNILRHKRWHDACLKLYMNEPNFLGFTASLRGLLEAGADAYYSLHAVPLTLAQNHSAIMESLSGHATSFAVCEDIETMLIHYQFGRRIAKGESASPGHKAASADTYIRAADGTGRTEMKDLYAELCQVVHPAAQSVMWMVAGSGESYLLTAGDDKGWILNLCRRHAMAIENLHMLSINTCILILKVLNKFSLHELWTDGVKSIQMGNLPAWIRIQNAFGR
jgi:hypothetical protein